jgi:hypothetical protein
VQVAGDAGTLLFQGLLLAQPFQLAPEALGRNIIHRAANGPEERCDFDTSSHKSGRPVVPSFHRDSAIPRVGLELFTRVIQCLSKPGKAGLPAHSSA